MVCEKRVLIANDDNRNSLGSFHLYTRNPKNLEKRK